MTMPRTPEVAAFLEALDSTPPTALSACVGWTAHEVTAHLAAGAAEVSRHLDPFLRGDAVPATRGFEEREAPIGPWTTAPSGGTSTPRKTRCACSSTKPSPPTPQR